MIGDLHRGVIALDHAQHVDRSQTSGRLRRIALHALPNLRGRRGGALLHRTRQRFGKLAVRVASR